MSADDVKVTACNEVLNSLAHTSEAVKRFQERVSKSSMAPSQDTARDGMCVAHVDVPLVMTNSRDVQVRRYDYSNASDDSIFLRSTYSHG